MSKKGDFLSGFSGGNTQKPLTDQNTTPGKETTSTEDKKTDVKKDTSSEIDVEATSKKIDVAANKKLADKIVADAEKKAGSTPKKSTSTGSSARPVSAGTATRPAQSANAIIKAPEHVVTRDEKFHKRKLIRYGIIGIVVIFIAILGFLIFRMMNNVEVPNWEGRELRDAQTWQITGGAAVDYTSEYSLEVDEGLIIRQSNEPGSTMSRNAVLSVVVSQGPDMNEVVDLPDFEEMTRGQIGTWANENRIRGITFREENSSDIEVTHVIRVEFSSAVDPDQFRRSDAVTIYVSTGPDTVQIGNMIGDSREEVDEFIAENPLIDVEIEYEPHETIERGNVLAQSHSSGTRLEIGETFTLTLSAGEIVTVPNFADMRRVEAREMAEDPEARLNVTVHDRWSATVPYGRFISQSVAAGEELYGESPTVIVVYSRGRPWVDRMIGQMANTIEPAIVAINDDGAFITVTITHVDSYYPRGQIISQSRYNQYVALDDHINFQVSHGNLEPPPDFVPPDNPGDDGLGDDGDLGPGDFDPDDY